MQPSCLLRFPSYLPRNWIRATLALNFLLFVVCFTSNAQQERQILRVGVYENYPKIFINEENQADGFFIDLLEYLLPKNKYSIEYLPVDWDEGIELLEKGKLDLLPDMILTRERENKFNLNRITVLENWASLYIHTNDEPEYYTLQNIKDIDIAALEGDNNLTALKKQLGKDTTSIHFLTYPSYKEVFRAVERQEVKLGLVNYYYGLMNDGYFEVQRLPLVINPATVHFAAPNGQHIQLLNSFDRKLCQLKDRKDSVYYALIEKWLDPSQLFRFPRWLSLLLSTLVVLSLFSILTLAISQYRLKESRTHLRRTNRELEAEIRKKTEAEEALRLRNEELANTNRTLDEFVYRVSHNLRAPLTSILGLIAVIQLEFQDSADALKQYIEKMETSIHKLDETIREIIDYSRNSRMEVICEEIDLQAMIQEIFESMAYLNADANIQLKTKIQAEAPFLGDTRRIYSVLQNLISNAKKYYNPFTEEHWISLEAQITTDEVQIWVKDNGMGIPEDQQSSIFNMFYRGSAQGSGAGLGLYIVRQTLERLNGTITVRSEKGDGSCFYLSLPNLKK